MKNTARKAETRRIRLAFKTGSELPKEALKSAVENTRDKVGAKDRDKIGFAPPIRVKPPLPALGFASGCASFVVPLVETLVKTYKGGTIIDLREQLPLISRDPHLPGQSIRVVSADGTDQIKASRLPEDTLGSILEGVLRLPQSKGADGVSKKDVEAVVNAAKTERHRAGTTERESITS